MAEQKIPSGEGRKAGDKAGEEVWTALDAMILESGRKGDARLPVNLSPHRGKFRV